MSFYMNYHDMLLFKTAGKCPFSRLGGLPEKKGPDPYVGIFQERLSDQYIQRDSAISAYVPSAALNKRGEYLRTVESLTSCL